MVISGRLQDVDCTAQLGAMRELPQRHRHLLEGLRIVVASADRVLISGLVHSLDGIGSLVGAASTEAEALACLSNTSADLQRPARARQRPLSGGSRQGPAALPALPDVDVAPIAQHDSRRGQGAMRRALQP